MKRTIYIPELNVKGDFDEDWFNPVKKMGPGTFRSVIENYFNAVVEIGAWSSIGGPLYVFGNAEHPCVFHPEYVSTYPFGDKYELDYPKASGKGKIMIGSDVWTGAFVTVLSGVTIGDGAIIGAQAVVAKDVPPYAVVVGNPAQIIKFRYDRAIINKLLTIKWWDWPEEKIMENMELMKNINKFVEVHG